MTDEELRESSTKISQQATTLLEANEDFEAAMCDAGADGEQYQADVEKTAKESIKLMPTALPKFTGIKRDYYRWRKEWEALQRQGEPTGSKEVKKFQLLDSLDERITRSLHLSSYSTAEDIFRILGNRFGNKTSIALEIVEELQSIPPVKGLQPRKIVRLIHAVEKALHDLHDLGDVGAIKNPLITKSIESKLPDSLKKDWLVFAANEVNAVSSTNRFDKLLAFLKDQECIYEQLEQLQEDEPRGRDLKHAQTRTTKNRQSEGCVVVEIQSTKKDCTSAISSKHCLFPRGWMRLINLEHVPSVLKFMIKGNNAKRPTCAKTVIVKMKRNYNTIITSAQTIKRGLDPAQWEVEADTQMSKKSFCLNCPQN
ncbi:hypothetical protein WMY93_019286 [Mugilogobius chulae]|uniref:Uncharacterized protein n=1 Tax=Mugilogobius chulae TaxID=88201 RepID=A0AAW0NF37_9GOBI